jgi:carbon dioxide concentrating mechanism protein CcmM
VITTQPAADRLPDANESDGRRPVFDHRTFSHHVVEINQALRAGYRCANDIECVTAFQNPSFSNGFYPLPHNGQVPILYKQKS